MKESQSFTYETRIRLTPAIAGYLLLFASYFGLLKRKLWNLFDIPKYEDNNTLKRMFMMQNGIPSRLYNSLKCRIEGQARSLIECLKRNLKNTEKKIGRVQGQISNLKKKITRLKELQKTNPLSFTDANKSELKKALFSCFAKNKKLNNLRGRVKKIKKELAKINGTPFTHVERRKNKRFKQGKSQKPFFKAKRMPSFCFGSKKTLNERHKLEKLGKPLEAWKEEWTDKRSDEIFMLGSKDEPGGNALCKPTLQEDGTISLFVRMPDHFLKKEDFTLVGKHIELHNLHFNHGHEHLVQAIKENEMRHELKGRESELGDLYKSYGRALTVQLKKRGNAWYVSITIDVPPASVITCPEQGAVGIDINSDHLAVSEIDGSGNPINSFNIPCITYGKSTNQAKAAIGDAVKEAVEYAARVGKPVVKETLEFEAKKQDLRSSARSARALSSFAYSSIQQAIHRKAHLCGVEVIEVDPAYTSMIGLMNWAKPFGLTSHQGAAVAIARRSRGYSEKPPKDVLHRKFPSRTGGLTSLHENDANAHVIYAKESASLKQKGYGLWPAILNTFKAGHAALYKARKRRVSVKKPDIRNVFGQPSLSDDIIF